MKDKILNFTGKVETIIIIALLFSLLLTVLYTAIIFIITLFWSIIPYFQESFTEEGYLLNYLHEIFAGFMLVLIGIELLHTIKIYLKEDVVHVEIVLLVAIIAVARHVIDLDMKHTKPDIFYGASALILTLSAGYFLIKKAMRDKAVIESVESPKR